MAEFPALPLWTDAYLADTSHLSEAEHGRYMLLLIHLWRAPRQRFPNNDIWLARKFKQSEEWVTVALRPLILEFCKCDGNWIRQKRLDKEWNYVSAASERQSARAKHRWEKEKALYHGNAEPHASGNAPTPTPTPTPIKKEKTTTLSADADGVVATKNGKVAKKPAYTPDFEAFWKAYKPPPNAKKPDAAKAWAAMAEPRPSQPDLLRAVSSYRAWLVEETKKRRGSEFPMQHPATWLRGRVWENYLANGAAASEAVLALDSDEERQNLKRLGVT